MQGSVESEKDKAPFYPAYTQLVTLIRGRVRYPEDWATLHDEAKKDFRNSRYSISDSLLDAASDLPPPLPCPWSSFFSNCLFC